MRQEVKETRMKLQPEMSVDPTSGFFTSSLGIVTVRIPISIAAFTCSKLVFFGSRNFRTNWPLLHYTWNQGPSSPPAPSSARCWSWGCGRPPSRPSPPPSWPSADRPWRDGPVSLFSKARVLIGTRAGVEEGVAGVAAKEGKLSVGCRAPSSCLIDHCRDGDYGGWEEVVLLLIDGWALVLFLSPFIGRSFFFFFFGGVWNSTKTVELVETTPMGGERLHT